MSAFVIFASILNANSQESIVFGSLTRHESKEGWLANGNPQDNEKLRFTVFSGSRAPRPFVAWFSARSAPPQI